MVSPSCANQRGEVHIAWWLVVRQGSHAWSVAKPPTRSGTRSPSENDAAPAWNGVQGGQANNLASDSLLRFRCRSVQIDSARFLATFALVQQGCQVGQVSCIGGGWQCEDKEGSGQEWQKPLRAAPIVSHTLFIQLVNHSLQLFPEQVVLLLFGVHIGHGADVGDHCLLEELLERDQGVLFVAVLE